MGWVRGLLRTQSNKRSLQETSGNRSRTVECSNDPFRHNRRIALRASVPWLWVVHRETRLGITEDSSTQAVSPPAESSGFPPPHPVRCTGRDGGV